MSDYTPTNKPINGAWNVSKVLRDEFSLIATAVNSKADVFGATSVSTTSLTIADTTHTFAMETGKEFVPGMSIYMGDAAAPSTNYMVGMLTAYSSTTGLSTASITSHAGSGTKSSWVIGLSNSNGVTLVNNAFTGHQDFARATVASHATTADIWSALGNQIDFTGTATVTAFPAAPQAGASRELICAGACAFTAGANMLIDGVSSGNTVTCAANDVIIVRAVTTTQFRLTRQRYDGLQQKNVGSHLSTLIHLGNGVGSSLTNVRLLTTTIENTLAATVVNSATDGSSITLPVSGMYFVQAQDGYTGAVPGAPYFGISRNSTAVISTGGALTTLAMTKVAATNNIVCISGMRYLAAGDVIRLLNVAGSAFNGTDGTHLRVTLLHYA